MLRMYHSRERRYGDDSELEREAHRPRVRTNVERFVLAETVERQPVVLRIDVRVVDPDRVVHVDGRASVEDVERERGADRDVRSVRVAFARDPVGRRRTARRRCAPERSADAELRIGNDREAEVAPERVGTKDSREIERVNIETV